MAKNIGVAALAENVITPLVNDKGYEIWDVEYVREGAEQYLRVTIDKDGGIDINDCERVHRAIMPLLENYEWDHLEVSSPGAERTLKKVAHFESAVGERAEIRLFAPDDDGKKSYIGEIVSADENAVTIKTDGGEISVPYSKIGKAKTLFDFEKI
ncbi:MAG: ribosome maturation factor RimP [Clostridia bacterium]|nr:ribosome maturation factor RimP [Clostridia bacterium]